MVNIYTYQFVSECPNDGEMICYSLELKSNDMLMVEHIKLEAALHKKAFGEKITQSFYDRFKCFVKLSAVHQGVHATHLLG
jgi:hypothetical protein